MKRTTYWSVEPGVFLDASGDVAELDHSYTVHEWYDTLATEIFRHNPAEINVSPEIMLVIKQLMIFRPNDVSTIQVAGALVFKDQLVDVYEDCFLSYNQILCINDSSERSYIIVKGI